MVIRWCNSWWLCTSYRDTNNHGNVQLRNDDFCDTQLKAVHPFKWQTLLATILSTEDRVRHAVQLCWERWFLLGTCDTIIKMHAKCTMFAHFLCSFVHWHASNLPTFFSINSLSTRKFYDRPSANEATLRNVNQWVTCFWQRSHKIEQSNPYACFMGYAVLWL